MVNPLVLCGAAESHLELLRELEADGDMMVKVGLDIYVANPDMTELVDTLRSIVRVKCKQ